jgi:hypothetical protein
MKKKNIIRKKKISKKYILYRKTRKTRKTRKNKLKMFGGSWFKGLMNSTGEVPKTFGSTTRPTPPSMGHVAIKSKPKPKPKTPPKPKTQLTAKEIYNKIRIQEQQNMSTGIITQRYIPTWEEKMEQNTLDQTAKKKKIIIDYDKIIRRFPQLTKEKDLIELKPFHIKLFGWGHDITKQDEFKELNQYYCRINKGEILNVGAHTQEEAFSKIVGNDGMKGQMMTDGEGIINIATYNGWEKLSGYLFITSKEIIYFLQLKYGGNLSKQIEMLDCISSPGNGISYSNHPPGYEPSEIIGIRQSATQTVTAEFFIDWKCMEDEGKDRKSVLNTFLRINWIDYKELFRQKSTDHPYGKISATPFVNGVEQTPMNVVLSEPEKIVDFK